MFRSPSKSPYYTMGLDFIRLTFNFLPFPNKTRLRKNLAELAFESPGTWLHPQTKNSLYTGTKN